MLPPVKIALPVSAGDHGRRAKKSGTPALPLERGVDLLDSGAEIGRALHADYGRNIYHTTRDTWRAEMDFSGAA